MWSSEHCEGLHTAAALVSPDYFPHQLHQWWRGVRRRENTLHLCLWCFFKAAHERPSQHGCVLDSDRSVTCQGVRTIRGRADFTSVLTHRLTMRRLHNEAFWVNCSLFLSPSTHGNIFMGQQFLLSTVSCLTCHRSDQRGFRSVYTQCRLKNTWEYSVYLLCTTTLTAWMEL